MDSEIGEKALERLIENLDSVQEFSIYTGFKNSPVTWDSNFLIFEEFIRYYPDFPGKPEINCHMTAGDFGQFCKMLEKHLGFSYCMDIINFEKQNGKYGMFSESSESKEFTKEEVIKFLHNLMKIWRIDIIEARNNLDFDLRDHLATDKKN